MDPNDNGGGVLGEMRDPNDGIPGVEELTMVSRKLCASVWSAGEKTVEARLTIAANAIVGEKPARWAVLHRAILNCTDPEAICDDPYGDPVASAEFANPTANAVLQNLPGITVTYQVLGGMTSGTSIFVWSDDPLAGRATIEAAVASAIRTVEMVVATLDGSDS